eukprot:362507-Chlamydomonas_euryale.AAC.12
MPPCIPGAVGLTFVRICNIHIEKKKRCGSGGGGTTMRWSCFDGQWRARSNAFQRMPLRVGAAGGRPASA